MEKNKKSVKKEDRLETIRRIDKFLAMLLLLNAADGFLTYLGVQSGYAVEVNALMVSIVTDSLKLCIYKILLPSFLVGLLAFIVRKAKPQSLLRVSKIIQGVVWIYICVLLLHAIWIWCAVYVIYR